VSYIGKSKSKNKIFQEITV